MAPTVPLICFSLYAALSYLAPRKTRCLSLACEGDSFPANLHIMVRTDGRGGWFMGLDLQSASSQPLRLSLHSRLLLNSLISHRPAFA